MKRIITTAAILASIVWVTAAPLNAGSDVETTSAGLRARVAPGESLPISVKLVNFGGSNRVDVVIYYRIKDAQGIVIHSAEETVAVETTASFVKQIQIPAGTAPGRYTAQSSILYPDQVAPATSEFPFVVERKILGLYQSDFIKYGGILLGVSVVVGVVSRIWVRRRQASRLVPLDYSDIPHDTRVFYELISDTVMAMRQKVGEKALDIAQHIEGLELDEKTGRVRNLTRKPSKIIADLVSGYEESLGEKTSFSFRR